MKFRVTFHRPATQRVDIELDIDTADPYLALANALDKVVTDQALPWETEASEGIDYVAIDELDAQGTATRQWTDPYDPPKYGYEDQDVFGDIVLTDGDGIEAQRSQDDEE